MWFIVEDVCIVGFYDFFVGVVLFLVINVLFLFIFVFFDGGNNGNDCMMISYYGFRDCEGNFFVFMFCWEIINIYWVDDDG